MDAWNGDSVIRLNSLEEVYVLGVEHLYHVSRKITWLSEGLAAGSAYVWLLASVEEHVCGERA